MSTGSTTSGSAATSCIEKPCRHSKVFAASAGSFGGTRGNLSGRGMLGSSARTAGTMRQHAARITSPTRKRGKYAFISWGLLRRIVERPTSDCKPQRLKCRKGWRRQQNDRIMGDRKIGAPTSMSCTRSFLVAAFAALLAPSLLADEPQYEWQQITPKAAFAPRDGAGA